MGIGISQWRFSHRLALWTVKGISIDSREVDCLLSVRVVNQHRYSVAVLGFSRERYKVELPLDYQSLPD